MPRTEETPAFFRACGVCRETDSTQMELRHALEHPQLSMVFATPVLPLSDSGVSSGTELLAQVPPFHVS